MAIEAIIFDWAGTLYDRGKEMLFPYSEKVLEKLSPKYKLAIISKAVPDSIETRLKQMDGIIKYFKVIKAGVDKTPEQYIECMDKLKVKPGNTLVVGNKDLGGVQIGKKLGCKTAWVQIGKYSHEIQDKKTGYHNYKIKTIEGLLKVL